MALAISVLVLGSCGRSAPDGGIVAAPASSVDADVSQDSTDTDSTDTGPAETADVPSTEQMAGVQAVSDAQLVTATTVQAATQPTASTTTAAAATTEASTYIVEPGDTLSVIAERFDIPLSALSDANGIGDVDTIKPGQELIIPASS